MITPCGGSVSEVITTLKSVQKVSRELPTLDITVHTIYNNGMQPIEVAGIDGIDVVVGDINPIASRARARNRVIEEIVDEGGDFLVFIDSGDELLPDALQSILELPTEMVLDTDVFICSSNVRTQTSEFSRTNRSIRWVSLINPFYLGSVLIRSSAIPTAVRFRDGRKEDWKFWHELFEVLNPVKSAWISQPNYIYNVKSAANHAVRKSKLVSSQYLFFRQFLGNSVLLSLFKTVLHYVVWWFIGF